MAATMLSHPLQQELAQAYPYPVPVFHDFKSLAPVTPNSAYRQWIHLFYVQVAAFTRYQVQSPEREQRSNWITNSKWKILFYILGALLVRTSVLASVTICDTHHSSSNSTLSLPYIICIKTWFARHRPIRTIWGVESSLAWPDWFFSIRNYKYLLLSNCL